jgi:CheY-like chemotaxis protein
MSDASRHARRRDRTAEEKRLVPTRPGAKILLVEDDFELRSFLAGALRRDGYAVVEAAHGDEALEWMGPGVLDGAAERLPALVVSDIRMPYFSGLEILQCVQLTRRVVPVILITGFGDSDTHALARALGDDGPDGVRLRGGLEQDLSTHREADRADASGVDVRAGPEVLRGGDHVASSRPAHVVSPAPPLPSR